MNTLVHNIHGSAALIFCVLYSWLYEVLATHPPKKSRRMSSYQNT